MLPLMEAFNRIARLRLNSFFATFLGSTLLPEFSIIHQGSSKGGQPFAIGQFKSGSETYRVFMKIKAINSQQLVHEISFAKE